MSERDLNEAKNAVYAAASPILEAIEHAGGRVGNGHHVAQRIAEAFEAVMLARARVPRKGGGAHLATHATE